MQKNSLIAIFLIIIMALSTTLSPIDQLESNDIQGVEGRQSAPLATNFTQMDQDLQDLYERWSLQGGLQAAIYHNGTLVYANSFGNSVSDESGNISMLNSNRMRIASLSKAITAAAIQTLVVSGDITLNDKMIDLLPEEQLPNELEGCEYPRHSDQYLDAGPDGVEGNADDVYWGIHDITVSHLLNMRNGIGFTPTDTTLWHYANHWVDDSTSWDGANNACIDHESVAEEYDNGFLAPVKIETTIRETLRLPMSSTPGTTYKYSNIGYRILGEIIEEASGLEYEDYVKQYVLEPMGINNLQLGKSLLVDKAEDEVRYYDRFGTTDISFFPLNTNDGSNEVVDFGDSSSTPKAYGGRAPMEELAASGGWIANAISYARFISYLDGTLNHPNFNDSFNFTINNPFSTSSKPYGAGINVNYEDNSDGETWWHTGSLPSFTSTKFDRKLVHDDPVVVVLLTNSAPGSDEEIRVNGQDLEWWEDRRNVMQTAFTTIDYQNLDAGRDSDRPLVYDESSPCPPGTSEQGSGAHIILFGPPQMKCYYNDQMGKKGPDFDEEKGWQKCPEGTSTSGVGEPYFNLWNEDGGFIVCYLDEELHPEEEPCPEGEVLNDDNRCVKESRAINSIGAVWTIVCILWAVFMSRRYRIN